MSDTPYPEFWTTIDQDIFGQPETVSQTTSLVDRTDTDVCRYLSFDSSIEESIVAQDTLLGDGVAPWDAIAMPIPRHAFPPGGDVLHLLCQDAACAAVALQPFPNLSVPLAVQYQEESFPHQLDAYSSEINSPVEKTISPDAFTFSIPSPPEQQLHPQFSTSGWTGPRYLDAHHQHLPLFNHLDSTMYTEEGYSFNQYGMNGPILHQESVSYDTTLYYDTASSHEATPSYGATMPYELTHSYNSTPSHSSTPSFNSTLSLNSTPSYQETDPQHAHFVHDYPARIAENTELVEMVKASMEEPSFVPIHSQFHLAPGAKLAEVQQVESGESLCRWGSACGETLKGNARGYICKHLSDFHNMKGARGQHIHKDQKVVCNWAKAPDDASCSQIYSFESLPNHISCTHFDTKPSYRCSECPEVFSRIDSAKRHITTCAVIAQLCKAGTVVYIEKRGGLVLWDINRDKIAAANAAKRLSTTKGGRSAKRVRT